MVVAKREAGGDTEVFHGIAHDLRDHKEDCNAFGAIYLAAVPNHKDQEEQHLKRIEQLHEVPVVYAQPGNQGRDCAGGGKDSEREVVFGCGGCHLLIVAEFDVCDFILKTGHYVQIIPGWPRSPKLEHHFAKFGLYVSKAL